jgi:hypothetical protein
MNETQLVEYLMEGITILKKIRRANEDTNRAIDAFLNRLASAAEQEEEKAKDPSSPKANPSGAESMSEKMKEMLKKIQDMNGGIADSGMTKKSMAEAMEKAKEAAMLPRESPLTMAGTGTLVGSSGPASASSTSALTATLGSDSAALSAIEKPAEMPSSTESVLKRRKVKKTEVEKVTSVGLPSAGVKVAPEVDSSGMAIGKVWCPVCEEFHSPEDAA